MYSRRAGGLGVNVVEELEGGCTCSRAVGAWVDVEEVGGGGRV
jgi:hypothetical protein